jgi:hypothetical protein
LRERAAANPIEKSKNVLRELIEARDSLAELRAEGRSSEKIQELLEAEQVHATAGTVRNYRAQICRAIEALELDGNSAPTDDEIHQMVIRLARARLTEIPSSQNSSAEHRNQHHINPTPTPVEEINSQPKTQNIKMGENNHTKQAPLFGKSDRENL